jgi:hypothetical protein
VISVQPVFEDPFIHQFASPMPALHVAQDCQECLVIRLIFSAQPQTMWNVLPKFRNQILLLYGCTSARQINSLQIRTLYLLQGVLSTIGSITVLISRMCTVVFYRFGMKSEGFCSPRGEYHDDHAHVLSNQNSLLWSSGSTTAA